MSMRAFDSANVTTGCPFRPWASRLGALSASALLSLFSSGLAFPAQPAPASASMLSPHADDTHPGPLASSGQSQSVAPGQTPKGISAEAWARMMAQVQSQTYEARPDPRHRDTLIADNAAQRLAVRFERNQVSFTTGTHATLGKHDRIIRLRSRLGEAPAQPVAPVTAGNRVEYPHAGYTEWYVNDAKGFEQGWTLGKPQGGGKTPYIRIEVTGARTVADGENAVRIEDRSGTLRYRYAGLKAWDADHRVLASTLRLARSGRIDIAVDDRGARYPITVDPTLTATQEIVLGAGGADSLTSVAVDGDTIVVGVDGGPDGGSGQAFIFSRNTGGADAWGLAATLNDPAQTDGDSFASAVAVNGDTVVVAGICAGFACAYIYERDQGGAGAWGLTTSNNFGAPELPLSVAVYGDTLVEHYGTSEVVYVSSRNARGPEAWGGTAVLTDPQGSSTDGFGYAVAINGDTLVVGASGTNNNQGQAYVYSLVADTNNWQLSASLSDPAATAGDGFGVSIAVNGDTLVVGATGSSGYQGKAYVFGRNQGLAGSWSLAKTLADPAATDQDDFGIAVAVNGDFVVVGADGVNNYQGKVYVFERNHGGAGSW